MARAFARRHPRRNRAAEGVAGQVARQAGAGRRGELRRRESVLAEVQGPQRAHAGKRDGDRAGEAAAAGVKGAGLRPGRAQLRRQRAAKRIARQQDKDDIDPRRAKVRRQRRHEPVVANVDANEVGPPRFAPARRNGPLDLVVGQLQKTKVGPTLAKNRRHDAIEGVGVEVQETQRRNVAELDREPARQAVADQLDPFRFALGVARDAEPRTAVGRDASAPTVVVQPVRAAWTETGELSDGGKARQKTHPPFRAATGHKTDKGTRRISHQSHCKNGRDRVARQRCMHTQRRHSCTRQSKAGTRACWTLVVEVGKWTLSRRRFFFPIAEPPQTCADYCHWHWYF